MIYEHNLNPYVFTAGTVGVSWYYTMYFVGFALVFLGVQRDPLFKAYGLTLDDLFEVLTWGFVGLMLGGRIGYVLVYNLGIYLKSPLEIFNFHRGGMSFHGGLAGAVLAVYLTLKWRKMSFWKVADLLFLYAPLALFCGRIGNFIGGELWGKPTGGNWGVIFPRAAGLDGTNPPRHPSQLYEACLEGMVLFFCLQLLARSPRYKPGYFCGAFLLGYALFRSLIEFCRVPDAQIGYLYGNWLTMGLILCLPLFLIGIWMLKLAQTEKLPGLILPPFDTRLTTSDLRSSERSLS